MEVNSIQKSEYQWFLQNYDDLYKKYGETYLVIKDDKVIANFKDFSEGIKYAKENEPLGSFIVHKCGKTRDTDAVSLYSHN